MNSLRWVPWSILAAVFYMAQAASQESAVTWSHQIAPLVYNNCTTCHHPGGAGPFSLLTYDGCSPLGAADGCGHLVPIYAAMAPGARLWRFCR